jgi:hypothetical protein
LFFKVLLLVFSLEFYFSVGISGMKHSLSYTYFGVSGHVGVSRLKSGFRKLIFDNAIDSHACHDFRLNHLANTIYYKDAVDNNLYFSLLFKSEDNAHAFQAKLLNFLQHPFKKMIVSFNNNKALEVIEATTVLARFVYPDDYQKADSTSPANSTHGFSVTELPNIEDPVRSLRSFENLALIPRKETIYGCHIAPKAFYKGRCATDPDNILYESHRFHGYFDGDGKRRPRGAGMDWGKPPELWIDYVRAVSNSTVVLGVTYHEVFVNIMFRDVEEANSMRGMWKDGTEDIGDIGFHTSFFTTNALKAKKYLELKRRETRIRWGMQEDMVTPQNPTIEEVEVVALEDSGEVELDLDNERVFI